MKKAFKFLSIALLCSALAFTACEKEETLNNTPQTVATTQQNEMDALLQEAYTHALSDTPVTITVPTPVAVAYRDRGFELFGSSISIALHENNATNTTYITIIANHTALSKKIWQNALDSKAAHFSSKEKAEIDKWKTEMKDQGYYQIIITLDENGIYHGVAYTKEEWDKLNQ